MQDAAAELGAAAESLGSAEDPERALGEVLLKIAAVARAMKADPEIALNAAVDRLIDRFAETEEKLLAAGKEFDSLPESELKKYWFLVKLSEKVL